MTWELTPELEETILGGLEDGIGLSKLCERDGMPSRSTVLRWQREKQDFDARCAHARAASAELSVDEQEDIVSRMLAGELTPEQARVALSQKQWRAVKLAPKKYGDKLTHATDPENPLKVEHSVDEATQTLLSRYVDKMKRIKPDGDA